MRDGAHSVERVSGRGQLGTRVKRSSFLVGALFVLGTAYAVWWIDNYRWAGGFREIKPHFSGSCRPIRGIPGPEDLLIDVGSGFAYVSSYDRAAARRGRPVPGAIFGYDLNHPDAVPVNLTPDATPDFRPHGLSLLSGANGRRRLFVVNHPPAGDTVEIFEFNGPERLVHARSIAGEALFSANDVVAVGPEHFYATNSRGYASGLAAWAEASFRMQWGNVVYFDGSGFSVALAGLGFPNGIDVSRRGSHLYVVASFDQAVHVYRRHPGTVALAFERSVTVGTRLDNVNVAEDGALWVAGRARYLGDPQPSQVVRITMSDQGSPTVEEIYVNLGDELGNASAAAVHERRLLIGSSRGSHFLDCVIE